MFYGFSTGLDAPSDPQVGTLCHLRLRRLPFRCSERCPCGLGFSAPCPYNFVVGAGPGPYRSKDISRAPFAAPFLATNAPLGQLQGMSSCGSAWQVGR